MFIVVIAFSSLFFAQYRKIEILQKLDNPLPADYRVEYSSFGGKYGWSSEEINYSVKNGKMESMQSVFRFSPPSTTCNQTSDSKGVQSCICKEWDEIINCTNSTTIPDQTNKLNELIQDVKKDVFGWLIVTALDVCYGNGLNGDKVCFSNDRIISYHRYSSNMGFSNGLDFDVFY